MSEKQMQSYVIWVSQADQPKHWGWKSVIKPKFWQPLPTPPQQQGDGG